MTFPSTTVYAEGIGSVTLVPPIVTNYDPSAVNNTQSVGQKWINELTNGIWTLQALINRQAQWRALAPIVVQTRDPVSGTPGTDYLYPLGQSWINPTNDRVWFLASITGTTPFWINASAGALGDVSTLTGNSGGAVGPSAGNINILGDGTTITIVGDPATHTLTASLIGGTAAIEEFLPNSGTSPVVPNSSGQVSVIGTGSTTTVGGTNIITIELIGLTSHAVLVGAGSATITKVGPTATAGQVLQSAGSSADPAFSTATYPSTTTINDILYSSSNNVVGQITASNDGVLISGTTGIPSWLANGTAGYVLTAQSGAPPAWEPISSEGAITTIDGDSGSMTPTTGVVTISGGSTGLTTSASSSTMNLTGTLGVAHGGTGATTLTQYGVLIGETTGAIQSVTGTVNYLLQANTGANPSFTTTPTVTSIDINSVNSMDPNAGVNVGYLSGIIAGLVFKQSCRVATTGSNLNATYANGTAGVGATLTNAGANAAFALDGVTTSTNDRVLIKDQSTTFQNGIYSVTTEGDGSTPWVLTRTTDFDSPATIEAGSFVAITSGTVNATTSWIQTQTITTVGTDPVLFVQFTYGPSTFLIKANNLSDVPSPSTARSNLGITNIATQSTTNHDVLVGAAGNAITNVTPGSAGLVLTSNGTSVDPSFQSITIAGAITEIDGDSGSAFPTGGKVMFSGGSGTGLTFAATSNTVTLGGTLTVGHGGLGITTTPSNGQIPIGNGTNYTAATLTAGTGISITNGSGSVTISATGSEVGWSDKAVSFNAASGQGYFVTANATATLPVSPSNGDTIEFFVDGSATLILQANTGQTIQISSSTSSSAGTQTNSSTGDACTLVYRSTTTSWKSTSFVGTWTET